MSRFVTSSLDDFSFVDDEGKRIPGLFGEDRESPEGSAATRQYSLSLTPPDFGGPDEVHAAFADEVRKLARRASAALHAALGRSADPHGVARAWAAEWTPKLASLLADARLAGELHGMRDLAGRFQGGVEPPDWEADADLPMVKHAASHLASMKLLGLPDYLKGRQEAEMAASEAAHDQTERVREALHRAVSDGGTLKDFRREAAGALDPAHAEVVFRDNVMAAYSAGQEKLLADPDVGGLFPYRQYVATHDTRVRSEHLALETAGIGGTAVYRADDPVWLAICPPKSHQCRCTWIALTVAQAAKLGVPEAQRWLESGIAPTSIKAFVAMPKLHVDADFVEGRELSALTPDPDPGEVVGLVELSTEWQRYQGPHGGHGWKNASTGEVRYQPEMPAEREGGGDEANAPVNAAKPAESPGDSRPKRPEGGFASAEAVKDHGKGMARAHYSDPHVRRINAELAGQGGLLSDAKRDYAKNPTAKAARACEEIGARIEELKAAASHESRRAFIMSFAVPAGEQAKIITTSSGPSTSHARQNWDKAQMYLSLVSSKDGIGTQYVDVRATKGRAYYNTGTIYTSKNNDPGVSAHEFGHHLERGEARKRVEAFRAKRFDPAKDVPMQNVVPNAAYAKDEVGNPDRFMELNTFKGDKNLSHYAGKTYEGGASEILSMGVEMLYRDPVHFAAADPEYFALIVGILQGVKE